MTSKRVTAAGIFRPVIIVAAAVYLSLFARLPTVAASPDAGKPPAAPPVGVARLISSRPGGRIGDAIPFTLEIRLADGGVLDSGSLAGLEIRPDRLPPELYTCTIFPFDRQKAKAKQSLNLKGSLVIYAPGDFRVGPTRLVGRRAGRDRKIRLEDLPAAALQVKVAALQPEISTSGPSLVIPEIESPEAPEGAPGRVAAASYGGILALLLALFCGIGVYLELRLSRNRAKPMPETGELESPAVRLRLLLADKKSHNDWRGLVAIDHRLRPLLLARLGLPGRLAGGCGRSFAGRLGAVIGCEKARKLELIYTEIDTIIARPERGNQARVVALKGRLEEWLADGLDEPDPAGKRPAGEGEQNGI